MSDGTHTALQVSLLLAIAMAVSVHWSLVALSLGGLAIFAILAAALWLLADRARHDLHLAADGRVYTIIDL